MKTQTKVKRTVVDTDTQRSVAVAAKSRSAKDVAEQGHESFIRNMLKDKMGWGRKDAAPDTIKVASKRMAAVLEDRDRLIAAAKVAQAKAAAVNAIPA